MGEIAERMERMTVEVTSPDGRIKARLAGGSRLTVRFQPDCYPRYRGPELAEQLARLGNLLWTGHRQGYLRVMHEVAGTDLAEDRPEDEWDAERRRYKLAQREIVADAVSPQGCLRMRAKCLVDWRVAIKDERRERLCEDEFRTEVVETMTQVHVDHTLHTHELLKEHFHMS